MPRDVTMPQLGMAQDAGRIVAWLKAPGDAVQKGVPLFEVETDKATMEVEAQEAGFLTSVTAAEGEDVPVGAVIARISESAGDDAPVPAAPAEEAEGAASGDALPEGRAVTMPQLGMAQDTGLLVSWLKAPGAEVAAGEPLFEVETDKSTMEVEAQEAGFLAATLAQPGEEVPVGAVVAILTDTAPQTPVTRSAAEAPAPSAAPAEAQASAKSPAPAPALVPATAHVPGGRILASPKLRRIAMEEGLDLALLVEAGHAPPYHMRDLETLRALARETPAPTAAPTAAPAMAAAAALRLEARVGADGLAPFAAWAAEAHGLGDADALLAGLAAASLPRPATIAVARLGRTRAYTVPATRALSAVAEAPEGATPDLVLRDLRGTALTSVAMGAEAAPVLTLMSAPDGAALTLECAPGQLDPEAAIRLLSDLAGRVEQPLRHLL